MRIASRTPLALLVLALFCSSCVSFQRWQKSQNQKLRAIELEDVAKSWCQTLRASQIIPVYPLTEDLMPGDVFLVRSTVDDQHEEYLERGFLPLDYQLARIAPTGYLPFYGRSILPVAEHPDAASFRIPGEWMRPDGTLPEPGQGWNEVPRAAFPSYSFSVKAGGGFNLALPVSGVPVGMSLMAAQSASGTISIQDGRTLGVDMLSLYADLESWSREHAEDLRPYVSSRKHPAYLRVVTRIYLVGALDVSLNASQSGGAGVDAGASTATPQANPAETPEGEAAPSAAERYTENLDQLNETLGNVPGAPGGALRITSASASTVTMREQFDPPLVLGYLGFDCEIRPGGELGPPCPTRVTLEDPGLAERLVRGNRAVAVQVDAVHKETIRLIRVAVEDPQLSQALRESGERVLARCDALASFVQPDLPVYKRSLQGGYQRTTVSELVGSEQPGFVNFTRFTASLRNSATVLKRALAAAGDSQPDDAEPSQLTADAERIEQLQHAAPWREDELRALRAAAAWWTRLVAASTP